MTDWRLRMIQGSDALAQEIVRALDETTIEVRFGDATPWRRQVLGIALVDILGRLFPRIAITGADDVDADQMLPPGEADFRDRLASARSHGVGALPANDTPALVVAVGNHPGDASIYCDANGWQSYIGTGPSQWEGPGDRTVPIGAVAAACRAAAHVFTSLLAPFGTVSHAMPTGVYSSALTYECGTDPLPVHDLPAPLALHSALAGAGSVGGAATYVFAHVPGLAGELEVIDYQRLEPHNPGRALLATKQLAARKRRKALVAVEALAHQSDLQATPHPVPLEDWVASRDRDAGLPLMLCAFDSVEARRELQDAIPLNVINAACDAEHIVISGHVTDDGPCVYCLHVPDVLDTERIAYKLIVDGSGLPPKMVQGLLEQRALLTSQHIAQIEDHRHFQRGVLEHYIGKDLRTLYDAELRYAETAFDRDGERVAVATPFVTALAGVLLAGEALKAGDDAYREFRLGPFTPGRNKYEENVLGSPTNALVLPVARWAGAECLCQSTRRLRLLHTRYQSTGVTL